jgi:PmbA protein
MIGRDMILSTLESVLAGVRADEVEAVFTGGLYSTTRYARSSVHQNTAVEISRVTFRVALGKRIGTASCSSFRGPELRSTLRAAAAIARKQKPSPDFPGFAPRAEYVELPTWDQPTADLTPRQRAERLRQVFRKGARRACEMSGAFTTRASEIAVATTRGARCYQAVTSATLSCIASGLDSSGYGLAAASRIADIDSGAVAAQALEKCRKSHAPRDLPARAYDVVLEPAAVAEILLWMSFIAFGSKALEEGTSLLAGRIGQKVMGENITIADDAFEPACPGLAFDFEGTPRQRIEMISRGIARSGVHSRLSAARAGAASTGHALPPEGAAEGAIPMYLQIGAGTESAQSLIDTMDDGLLVPRLHYVNGFLDPRKALMTGMTRDGLLRIRKGRLAGGVKNLRFTDSIMEAFSRVDGVSKERVVVHTWNDDLGSSMLLPLVRVRGLRFSGNTEF